MFKKTISSKNIIKNYSAYLLVIIAFLICQILISTNAMPSLYKGLMVQICVNIVMALSLNLTVGILGELSLGHAGFMSVGFTTSLAMYALFHNIISSPVILLIVCLICGAIMAAIFGVLIGIPVLRLRGDYLAIVTLAFGEIIRNILNNLFLGIDSNNRVHIGLVEKPAALENNSKMLINSTNGISVDTIATFTAGFILVMITLVVIFNTMRSRTGRAIMSIRDNRIASECVGINITKYKLTAFAISAAIAGAAGALFSLDESGVGIQPNYFGFNQSIMILVYVVLGGQGNMIGSIISATVLTILSAALLEFADYSMLVYAIVLIIIMLMTNNPTLKAYLTKFQSLIKSKLKKKKIDVDAVTDSDKTEEEEEN